MALATRNLYLVLKARDEASRVIRGFGRELSTTNDLANAAGLRNQANLAAQRAAQMKLAGAAQADIDQQVALSRTLRDQAQELERHHRNIVRLTNAMQSLSSTLVTVGSGFAIVGAAALYAMGRAIAAAVEYQRQVALTMTQITTFAASASTIGQIGLDVANSIAVPLEDIQPALYNIFSSTNANLAQAQTLLEGFAKTAVAGQVSIADAAAGTIPILNAYNIPLEQVNKVLDIQFQLVRYGVGTYQQFSTVFGRVVPSATRANQSFQEVAAMLAYLTRNGLSAAMASTSAARALDALSNPKAVAAMENLGIKVRDVHGQLLPLQDVLTNIQKYLLSLPEPDRVKALVGIFQGAGGTIQARRFLDQILLRPGELDEFKGFLQDMNNANGAFGQAYATMADTVAAKTQLLKNQFKVFEVFAGEVLLPIWSKILGFLTRAFEAFNNLSPGMKKWIVIISAVIAALTLFGGIIIVVLGVLAGLIAAILSAGVTFFAIVGGIGLLVAGLILLGGAFFIAYQKSAAFRDLIKAIGKVFRDFWDNYMWPVIQSVKKGFEEQLLPALKKFWTYINQNIIPILTDMVNEFDKKMIPKLKELAPIVGKIIVDAFKFMAWVIMNIVIPALKEVKKFYDEHKQAINDAIDRMTFGIKILYYLGLAFLAFIQLLQQGGFFHNVGEIIKGFMQIADWIGTAIGKVYDLIDALTALSRATTNISGAAGSAFGAAGNAIRGSGFTQGAPQHISSSQAPQRTINSYVSVTTQQLNPVSQAAQLGALLAGKL